ncbi:CobD/CbiB family cobalamin biosynthesis protein [Haloarcula onubensis]|uniref:Probable cobalamin biosynthesis protein CobD n=1 Tax=Haloarcula onubensis TaxID=2950539 RepID=A0ABU2FJK6_9EURY|nr:CobD/CbiB family cobalamin biosynthesis protein [Halomicroarcula sp. S3CR25-11]MDS0280933.1 cobalamin biosynthesis protein [Halomicroarcula sp. S3CR25-11]
MIPVVPVLVAGALETLVGEPPTRYHPVAWFGRLVAPLDREWRRPLLVGALGALALPLWAAVAVALAVVAAGSLSPLAAPAVAGLVLFLSTSLRRLLAAADSVAANAGSDIDAARDGLLALAGRDASALSSGQLRSAAVESAAENLADGLLAPLSAFVLAAAVAALAGAPPLPVAAAGAAWVKGVNTLDSMLGYPDKRVGTPAARLDDAVMWLPARLSALVLAVALADPRSLARTREWLDGVPSPNSGWPMGVAAAGLDVRLEKPGVYVLNPGAALPDETAARRGVRAVGVAGVTSYAVAGLALVALGEVSAWF